MQVKESFNLVDTDGNGALTRAEVAARKTSDQGYRHEQVDALTAQIIEKDRNMDGFLQASEYGELMAEGTVYGPAPDFPVVARGGRIDYCQLTTRLAMHHGRQYFSQRDTNKDNTISFREYAAHADISGAMSPGDCLERETGQGSPSTCCNR
jgi:hypothetical protein